MQCMMYVQVDDKYQYSCNDEDNKVHGWICFDPPVGFWQITPSDEFRTGGPVKQNLTSHVGPTTLAVSSVGSQHLWMDRMSPNQLRPVEKVPRPTCNGFDSASYISA